MRRLTHRIRIATFGGFALAIAAIAALGLVYVACANSLHRTCFVTGWGLMLVMTFSFVRRLVRLRAGGDPARWVGPQTGLAVVIVALFLMHVEFSRPNGWLDTVLAGLFVVVVITGAFGALLWAQLRTGVISCSSGVSEGHDESNRESIILRANGAFRRLSPTTGAAARAAVEHRLLRQIGLAGRALGGGNLSRVLRELDSLKAGANNADTEALGELSSLVLEKDRLDAERIGDRVVQRWLLLHTPCVASLLTLGAMHGVIAHAHGLLAHVMLGK